MMKLVRQILVMAMLAVVPVSAFAQGKGGDKRPKKEPVKIVTNDGKGKPPQKPNRPPKQDPKKKP
jgi:hypothetical protein